MRASRASHAARTAPYLLACATTHPDCRHSLDRVGCVERHRLAYCLAICRWSLWRVGSMGTRTPWLLHLRTRIPLSSRDVDTRLYHYSGLRKGVPRSCHWYQSAASCALGPYSRNRDLVSHDHQAAYGDGALHLYIVGSFAWAIEPGIRANRRVLE